MKAGPCAERASVRGPLLWAWSPSGFSLFLHMPSNKEKRAEQQRTRRANTTDRPKDKRDRSNRARPSRDVQRMLASDPRVLALEDMPSQVMERKERNISRTSTSTAHSAYKPPSLSARDSRVGSALVSLASTNFLRGCEDLMTHADDLPDLADLDEHRAPVQ